MVRSILVLAIAIAVAGCADPDLGTVEQHDDQVRCPRLICGNTPYLGAYPFWELDSAQKDYSTNGLVISDARYLGVQQRIVVLGFHWWRNPVGTNVLWPIAGTTVTVSTKTGDLSFELDIQDGTPVHYYEGGDDGTVIPTYKVRYVTVIDGHRGPIQDMCRPDDNPNSITRDAIVFRGDRYDATTGSLIAIGGAAGTWFNIACKEDAGWKLAVMRMVEAASSGPFVTDIPKRQAMLRSIRADYCGDGTPLTELGTGIDWLNAGNWLWWTNGTKVESVWGSAGALCLSNTRIPNKPVPCALKTCTDILSAGWKTAGWVLTLVP